ncbi:MAG: hypothetical protein JNL82_41855 [Myxococcales bacterium]|nr:hypothetical protein [Myxococcales bacterium]
MLARLIEDEWNLYENRVAVRLVDHLLAYVARRLAELNKVERSLHARKEHIDVVKTSFWRADRITTLWARALDSKIEDDLRATRQQLEHARRDLQALLDAPLYQQVPRRATVALSLRPTNILINDPHYRKVAALWRAWVKLGHKRQETREQRAARRQLEARAWDRFVLHLVVRAFSGLSWRAARTREGWTLSLDGHSNVYVTCPVCGKEGHVEAQPGKESDGSDATWWAHCAGCESEWGLRLCRGCGVRYRALAPAVGLDLQQAAACATETDWPDRVLGRDVWAQPCRQTPRQFRCPNCGRCAQGKCGRCQ